MADTQTIMTLKDYFRKLLRTLQNNSDVTFFGHKLIKKTLVDDILCCILALLPNSYKSMLKDSKGRNLNSILAYNFLFNAIKRKFVFNSNVYLVNFQNVKSYIDIILRDLEGDIDYIEKNFS